jgi:hypothetical protein
MISAYLVTYLDSEASADGLGPRLLLTIIVLLLHHNIQIRKYLELFGTPGKKRNTQWQPTKDVPPDIG